MSATSPHAGKGLFLMGLFMVVMLTGCDQSLTVTVRIGGSGAGSVASSPTGINCASPCLVGQATFTGRNAAPTVVLTATPNPGTVFAGWGGACSGSAPSCTVSASGSATAVAFFRTLSVSAGAFHTCALRLDGTVACWGRNDHGQIGEDPRQRASINTPLNVPGLQSVVQIAAGAFHTCALLVDGSVQCWGLNRDYELGAPGVPDAGDSFTPITTRASISNGGHLAVSVAAGGYHACSVLDNGQGLCWGFDANNQIGAGYTTSAPTPYIVSSSANFIAFTGGAYHTCALDNSGSVWCWGYNADGEVGDAQTTQPPGPQKLSPFSAPVAGLGGALGAGQVGLATYGGYHTCAVVSDGTVWCWGYNGHFELGRAGFSSGYSPVPLQVSGIDGTTRRAISVTAGAYHSCALLSDGTAECWGNNKESEIGAGLTTNFVEVPTAVAANGILAISAGGDHNCAIFAGTSGTIKCWGLNDDGEAGVGNNNTVPTPTDVRFF